MSEKILLLVCGLLLVAAVLIPVPPRGRAVLWAVLIGLIATVWGGESLGYFALLP